MLFIQCTVYWLLQNYLPLFQIVFFKKTNPSITVICYVMVFLLPFPIFAWSVFSRIYETCSWKNKTFTERIIQETQFYCPSSTNDKLSKCTTSDLSKIPFCGYHGNLCKNSTTNEIKNIQKIIFREQTINNHIPKECFFISQLLGVHLWPAEKNTYYYCHSSRSGQTLKDMHFHSCKSKENKQSCILKTSQNIKNTEKTLRPRPPCSSKAYISLITQAFNQITDYFGLTERKKKRMLFALFHHKGNRKHVYKKITFI